MPFPLQLRIDTLVAHGFSRSLTFVNCGGTHITANAPSEPCSSARLSGAGHVPIVVQPSPPPPPELPVFPHWDSVPTTHTPAPDPQCPLSVSMDLTAGALPLDILWVQP